MRRISPRLRLALMVALPAFMLVSLLSVRFATAARTQPDRHLPTSAQPTGLSALSLVWLDQRSGQGVDVWIGAYDGSDARMVASFPNGARAMAMGGPYVAIAVSDGIALLDLRNGESRTIAQRGQLQNAVISGDTLFYAVRNACGGPGPGQGLLFRVDIPTGTRTDLGQLSSSGASIINFSESTNTLSLIPRGCDPGFIRIERVDAGSGMQTGSFPVNGCGWGAETANGQMALVSHQACAGRDEGGPVALYNLADGSVRPLTPPEGSFTGQPFLPSPDSRVAAFAVSVQQGSGPGSTRSGGLWLLDLASVEPSRLWADGGAEALAVAWSPDGAYLLAGSVQAQGLCSFAVIALPDGAVQPVNDEITVCGVNGDVLGWTRLG